MKKILSLLSVVSLGATSSIPTIKNVSHNTIIENSPTTRNNLYMPYLDATANLVLTGAYGYRNEVSKTFTLYWSDMGVTGYAGFIKKYSKIKFKTEGSYMELRFYGLSKYLSADGYKTGSITSIFQKTHDWRSALYYIRDENPAGYPGSYNGTVLIETRTDDSGIDIRSNVYIEGSGGQLTNYIKGRALISEIELIE